MSRENARSRDINKQRTLSLSMENEQPDAGRDG